MELKDSRLNSVDESRNVVVLLGFAKRFFGFQKTRRRLVKWPHVAIVGDDSAHPSRMEFYSRSRWWWPSDLLL